MIQTPETPEKHDRLTAFLKAFGLQATTLSGAAAQSTANLFVAVPCPDQGASQIIYHCQGGPPPMCDFEMLIAARIDFGGLDNPLVGALPAELVFLLDEAPILKAIADQIVAEARTRCCGGATVLTRLCEVIVVLAIRRAIDAGTVNAGLLAGLAHPVLHPSLVALHDAPERPWRIEALAQMVGLSRSSFMTQFSGVVGETPGAYLTSWRLALGRRELRAGRSVKAVAARVGFGSAAAFSRAFSRKYGHPPGIFGRVAPEFVRGTSAGAEP
jgi:AraC-like DNA-binding protein